MLGVAVSLPSSLFSLGISDKEKCLMTSTLGPQEVFGHLCGSQCHCLSHDGYCEEPELLARLQTCNQSPGVTYYKTFFAQK
jgi:hypothetical protein